MSTGVKIGIAVLIAAVLYGVWYMMYRQEVPLVPVNNGNNASGGTDNILLPAVENKAGNQPTGQQPTSGPMVPAVSPAVTAAPVGFSGPLVGKFNADNYLSVKVNGVTVYGETTIEWGETQNVALKNVRAGDRVDFNVRNAGGPGGFIGSWTWNGKTYNVEPTVFPGKTVIPHGGPWGYDILSRYSSDAKWLWSPDNCEVCVHTFTWMAK